MPAITREKRCCSCKKNKFETKEHFYTKGKNEDGSIKWTSDCKECRNKYHKQYRKTNSHKFNTNKEVREKDRVLYAEYYKKYWREWRRNKHKTDIQHQLRTNLRGRIWHALKGNIKHKNTITLISCSIIELIQHLEKQFVEGMTWRNYGKWHVDHKLPCSKFDLSKEEEQKECFHYTNLQPLWAIDNIRKGNKIYENGL